ncbi:cytochrome b/b6 domain-containing protein [Brunnivagina elsteri]|uniref:Cytochrome B n=1 Tax=Brunnivagina elsteri CCALA 953 TaxID=987040 RepID=A0A2A2TM34_9CYAN|nr:cytochrome b/b6 domain-containing protein [Calothrix elsteri]PAX59495.1 cytochrome B [Calothrix elsteri CCALA 953]
MLRSKLYQPLLLRLFHGINALLIIGAAITGFLVYDSWDGRFGGLSLTKTNRSLIDIHGTFGFFISYIALPLFLIYCWKAGKNRLLQADTLQQLGNVGRPIWWYTLQRIANTFMLIAALFSVISGKFQDENWLPQGELNHVAYYIHLIAWVVVILALSIHLLMSAKVGGLPLLISMFDTIYRPEDSPRFWQEKLNNILHRNK